MTYLETLDYLYGMLPMYQRVGKAAYKKDLTNTLLLLEALDNPHHKFESVHIAGTNGKGTSAHGIAAIMQTAGYKTGLYTSPHLKRFAERIKINGTEVEDLYVVDFVKRNKHLISAVQPSFFEVTVAMAFDYFASRKIDIAVIETGLGGRLDSTNVISPKLTLITNIGMDHTDILGDTLEKIAFEKAGIIKEHVPIVIGEPQKEVMHVFENAAKEKKSKLISPPQGFDSSVFVNQTPPSDYLLKNIPGIVTAVEALIDEGWKVTKSQITDGLLRMNVLTGFKGRFQMIGSEPLTIADISHNREGLFILFRQITKMCEGKLHVVFGTVKDKSLTGIFDVLPPGATYYWTEANVPRALPAKTLQTEAKNYNLIGETFQNVTLAMAQAKMTSAINDIILITGSTFVVAEIESL